MFRRAPSKTQQALPDEGVAQLVDVLPDALDEFLVAGDGRQLARLAFPRETNARLDPVFRPAPQALQPGNLRAVARRFERCIGRPGAGRIDAVLAPVAPPAGVRFLTTRPPDFRAVLVFRRGCVWGLRQRKGFASIRAVLSQVAKSLKGSALAGVFSVCDDSNSVSKHGDTVWKPENLPRRASNHTSWRLFWLGRVVVALKPVSSLGASRSQGG